MTDDLHADGPSGVMTDYEEKFYLQGIPINRCVARRPDAVLPAPDVEADRRRRKEAENEVSDTEESL